MEYVIRRAYVPLHGLNPVVTEDVELPTMGEQFEWWAHIPAIHRALTNPIDGEIVPAPPPPGLEPEE